MASSLIFNRHNHSSDPFVTQRDGVPDREEIISSDAVNSSKNELDSCTRRSSDSTRIHTRLLKQQNQLERRPF